ncbi:alpha/beta hydrolase [Actinocrispum sp. NPDC049592]|uniref:alpha/beta hydrolase n=1 Tax=Actinocrispum sp. NPDC049592 TaxID=3154835 RepID=UPI0034203C55
MRRTTRAVLFMLPAASALFQWLAERRDSRRFPPPGELVDIGGRRMHVLRSGGRGPVVVVQPGLGTPALEWVRVQDAVAARSDASVIVVDRGGIGWSDPAAWPRTPAAMAGELDSLITALRIEGPVIMVGHSLGGLVARVFAARHPDRVAELILVDASHEDNTRVLSRLDPKMGVRDLWTLAVSHRARVLGLYRARVALGLVPGLRKRASQEVPADLVDAHIARSLTTALRRAVVQEALGMIFGMTTPRTLARHFGDLPITVVTAGPDGREQWFPAWEQLQADFLTMSSNTRQVRASHTTHNINVDDPDLVAAAILAAIARSRTSG